MEQLGPYQLVKRLGRGGMGTVYEGVHAQTGQRVAVKALAAPLVDDPGFRDRFEAEIEALRKLNHPGIVRLVGHGEQQGQAYYAMELVDGASLEEELRRGRHFDWREVARIGMDLCAALRHAHDRGIVHRDIKPGNLLFAADGSVKLSDFGIARLFGGGPVTGPGSVLGTVEYMAPEQAEGRATDNRSDLYSLGCVLYALLARRPPYRATNLAEMLAMHRSCEPEPIDRLAPDVPQELQAIITQLLRRDPIERTPNAMVLARRLEALLDHSQDLPDTVPGEVPPPVADMPPARDITAADRARPPQNDPPADDLPETKESLLVAAGGSLRPAIDYEARTQLSPAVDHFTPVEDDPADAELPPAEHRPLVSLQTWLLVIALLSVGGVLWYLLQPPTADDLYDRIAGRAAEGDAESLLAVEDQIDQFLMTYPKDSRAPTLRHYAQEIQLYRLERRFERRAAGLVRDETLLPVERDYLEAIHYARFDPPRAMRKLQAILDLYDSHADASGPVGQCLRLVQRRLERLREQVQRQAPQQIQLIEQHLVQAEALFATDPVRARAMCAAVVELFSDKPWAAEWVRRAQRDLELHRAADAQLPASKPKPKPTAKESSKP
jgi:serine/threonine-protein kinase